MDGEDKKEIMSWQDGERDKSCVRIPQNACRE